MPSFLSRSFSSRKKDAQKTTESARNPVPSSPSRFKILPSRSASRPPSSSSAVDGGTSRMRSLLTRTPTATRTESRGGENNPTARRPLQPPGGALDGGAVGTRVDDRPVSSGNSKPNQLSAPIRGPSPQRSSSTPNPQRGLSQANRHTSPFPPGRTPQQDYQQQLRRSTASPQIPSRGPSRGPSPYNGPYPLIQSHNQWPAPFNPIDDAENFNVLDFYSRQGTPKLRNPSRNSTRNYPRSQSLTSESAGHYPVDQMEGFADFAPPSRGLKGPHLEPGEKKSSQNMRSSNPNIASVMLGNRGPGGMGMGMGMASLDGGLNPNLGLGNMPRRGGNIPPMPRIPSMYKPSAQSVRNQNQMMNSNNYSQYPPAFRNGKPRNNQGQDGQVSPLYPDYLVEGALQNPMDRAQPPRMQSPRHFQPPHRPRSTGPRGPDMGPRSQDRRPPKAMSGSVNGHRDPELTLLQSSDNPSSVDTRNPDRKSDPQQPQQQPTIPTALPTPSLTPTPPSRSNSNEDRQNSDEESLTDEGLEIPNKSRPVSEANSARTYQQWQENGQNHGYFRRPPPYQRLDPQQHMHSTSPPSPISAPATPVTSSSASSTHGISNQVIAQQIQVSAPIMPGPVKEICYTKDINLVMEECMMGHGRAGRDNVMRRTANWQHRVGCMMCGDYGGPGEDKVESGQTMAGKQWLWLCSWCALRVCADCRCRLGDEEDRLREKRGTGVTLKVNLTALRSKIIEEKKREQKRKSAEVFEIFSSEDQAERHMGRSKEKMERQEVDKEVPRMKVVAPPVKSETQKLQSDVPKKVSLARDETAPIIKQNTTQSSAPVAARPVKSIDRPSPPVSTSSEESVNSFATAGSRVEFSTSHGVAKADEIKNQKTEHPPRVSSRNLPTEIKVDQIVSDKEQVISSQSLEVQKKQVEMPLTPKPLPIKTSTKTAINVSTKTTIIVSSPVITSPKSPESPSRKPLPASATIASSALQAAVRDAPKADTTTATATFVSPLGGDGSLRAVVSPEMLALITGVPVAEQPKAKSAPPVPVKPQSSARDLAEAFVPPPVPAKSPPPSRGATISPPPAKSSSSTLLAPLVQVKSFISAHGSPPQPQNAVKHKPVTQASPSSLPTVEKFVLPPLSFESEISNEIDNIFGTRQYTAPKAQATHDEEAYRHEAVTSSPKGGRRWYKGLFSGRK